MARIVVLVHARCSPKKDGYHNNNKASDVYLSFCIVKTIFTNDESKHYVFIKDLGRNK